MNKTILLIEDNEQNRYLATFLLEKHGYSVVPASDGVTGIELGLSFQPKGILLDIQLPGLDGYEVARALRRNALLDGVPIIAVTSYAMAGDREGLAEVLYADGRLGGAGGRRDDRPHGLLRGHGVTIVNRVRLRSVPCRRTS